MAAAEILDPWLRPRHRESLRRGKGWSGATEKKLLCLGFLLHTRAGPDIRRTRWAFYCRAAYFSNLAFPAIATVRHGSHMKQSCFICVYDNLYSSTGATNFWNRKLFGKRNCPAQNQLTCCNGICIATISCKIMNAASSW